MHDLLLNPAIQSGILPALAALLVLALTGRTSALVLVPMAGFLTVVVLAVGFSLEPMTARSKVVACVLAAGALALVLDLVRPRAVLVVRAAVAALTAAAAVWVAFRVLQQKEGSALWAQGAAVVVFALVMVESARAVAGDSLRCLVVGTLLGFTSGALGLLGASSSAAFMGIALGASYGVALLAQMVRGRSSAMLDQLVLPAAVFSVLGGLMACLTGELPWYALLPLPLIPWVARFMSRPKAPAWRDALVTGFSALVPAIVAVGLAYWSADGRSGA